MVHIHAPGGPLLYAPGALLLRSRIRDPMKGIALPSYQMMNKRDLPIQTDGRTVQAAGLVVADSVV